MISQVNDRGPEDELDEDEKYVKETTGKWEGDEFLSDEGDMFDSNIQFDDEDHMDEDDEDEEESYDDEDFG